MKNTVAMPFTPSGSLLGSMRIALLLFLSFLFCWLLIEQVTTLTTVTEDQCLPSRLSGKYDELFKKGLEKLSAQHKKHFLEVYGEELG
jgi:hypothetical protein